MAERYDEVSTVSAHLAERHQYDLTLMCVDRLPMKGIFDGA